MQVTQEDGGKLNAFANEPRMVVMEPGEASRSNRLLLIGGGVLVLVLMAVAQPAVFGSIQMRPQSIASIRP